MHFGPIQSDEPIFMNVLRSKSFARCSSFPCITAFKSEICKKVVLSCEISDVRSLFNSIDLVAIFLSMLNDVEYQTGRVMVLFTKKCNEGRVKHKICTFWIVHTSAY